MKIRIQPGIGVFFYIRIIILEGVISKWET